MRRFAVLIGSIMLLISCRVTKEEVDSSVVISMQKTKCHSTCPEYTLDIYNSGKVYFVGRENVDKIGEYEIKLSKKELNRLVGLFLTEDFFSYSEQIPTENKDLPTTYLYFSHNGQRKRVSHHEKTPENLEKLEYEVAQLIKIPKWKQVDDN